jgi:hypothetical protein
LQCSKKAANIKEWSRYEFFMDFIGGRYGMRSLSSFRHVRPLCTRARNRFLNRLPRVGALVSHALPGVPDAGKEPVTLDGLREDIVRLQGAVRNGEKDGIDHPIPTIQEQNPRGARALKDLADNYDYDASATLWTGALV